MWWQEQVPQLARAYLPTLAARRGGGLTEDAFAVRFWTARVLPELRRTAASTSDDFEQHLGSLVALTGIDVVPGTVAVATYESGRAG